jgi:hypothetical protein
MLNIKGPMGNLFLYTYVIEEIDPWPCSFIILLLDVASIESYYLCSLLITCSFLICREESLVRILLSDNQGLDPREIFARKCSFNLSHGNLAFITMLINNKPYSGSHRHC